MWRPKAISPLPAFPYRSEPPHQGGGFLVLVGFGGGGGGGLFRPESESFDFTSLAGSYKLVRRYDWGGGGRGGVGGGGGGRGGGGGGWEGGAVLRGCSLHFHVKVISVPCRVRVGIFK